MNIVKNAILLLMLVLPLSNALAVDQNASNAKSKALVKSAVIYALENRDPNMDYGKYVSKNFINPIDGNTFNFKQWVAHQKNIKKMVKSMKPIFGTMVAENNQVAAIYRISLVKNDGTKLEVKDLAFFKIKNNKIIYCEELTQLLKGDKKDKNIGSTK